LAKINSSKTRKQPKLVQKRQGTEKTQSYPGVAPWLVGNGV